MEFRVAETYEIKEWETAYYYIDINIKDTHDDLTASQIEDVKAYIKKHGLGEYEITLNGVDYEIDFDDNPFDWECNSSREKTDEPTEWDIEEKEYHDE